jgi:hypothetical protein
MALVTLAREFNRVWRLYSNPSDNFGRQRGPRNHAITTNEDGTQANATTTPQRPQLNMGKLSKEEKGRQYKEKLCFYCGKPNHTAKTCRLKQSGRGQFSGNRPGAPRQDVRARATVAQEESYEDTPDDHPSQTVALSRLQILHSSQEMAAINKDF